jgi:hypothetical protein
MLVVVVEETKLEAVLVVVQAAAVQAAVDLERAVLVGVVVAVLLAQLLVALEDRA